MQNVFRVTCEILSTIPRTVFYLYSKLDKNSPTTFWVIPLTNRQTRVKPVPPPPPKVAEVTMHFSFNPFFMGCQYVHVPSTPLPPFHFLPLNIPFSFLCFFHTAKRPSDPSRRSWKHCKLPTVPWFGADPRWKRILFLLCLKLKRNVLQALNSSWDGRPFGHNRHGPKVGGCTPLEEGELGPHLTQCRMGRGLPPYQVASWSIKPFGHMRHGPRIIRTQTKRPAPVNFENVGAAVPLSVGRAGCPSNTMWPGPQQTWADNWRLCRFGGRELGPHLTQCGLPRPTSVPNGILIRPTVWPQQTWAAYYTDAAKACARKFRKCGGCCAP